MMRRLATGAIALVVVTAVVATVAYRREYGTWWQAPQRITFCGRTYLAGASSLSLAEVHQRESHTALPGDSPYPIVTIGRTPPIVGLPMVAALTPDAQRRQIGLPCTMGIYLQTAKGTYTAYGISGGP